MTNIYTDETEYLDYSADNIQVILAANTALSHSNIDNAVSLYRFVRDKIKYDPYKFGFNKDIFQASSILTEGSGYCVSKAILYAALLRATGIPSRIGFADVKNHITSDKLRQAMGTDIFYYHGYTEVFLDRQWIKATPAFNVELCEKAGIFPLEFDGKKDSIFHPFTADGKSHMEYLKDHGGYDDVPYNLLVEKYTLHYNIELFSSTPENKQSDFFNEVAAHDNAERSP